MLIAGLDDAGRGAVIGPLVIGGVLTDENGVRELQRLGVKDSKKLNPKRRRVLYEKVRGVALKCHVIIISPSEVDYAVSRKVETKGLNRLEGLTMARMINYLRPDVAYIDASDVSIERFKKYILEGLTREVDLIIEHKADSKYPIVSAASIVAKVTRDQQIESIKRKYGDFGSGYMSDPRTVKFLRELISREKRCPKFVRASWKPVKKLIEKTKSIRIDSFR